MTFRVLSRFLAFCSLLVFASPSLSSGQTVDFDREVRPILNTHCVACHGGVKQASDLSFIYRDQALSAITPGDAGDSEMIRRILSDDAEEWMPPPEHGRRLNPEEVETLTRWIDEGAAFRKPWAYESLRPVPSPGKTTQTAFDGSRHRSRDRIDDFVRSTLDTLGVRPSPAADPNQWLRRVHLDLTGLPPTAERVESFPIDVRRDGEIAYVREVDRLLADPGFGHRWASVWLDQIRYADSCGLGLDRHRNVWPYRDWVISAENRDMPFDEFTVAQIAGDLLPEATLSDQVATTAHRLTQTNQEGGTDDEEFRVAAVIDRIGTVWQAWMGVTFACAQCHAHPYDPIRNEDFYRFAAFFNNTIDSDTDQDHPLRKTPKDADDYEALSALQKQHDHLTESIWVQETAAVQTGVRWHPFALEEISSSTSTTFAAAGDGDPSEFVATTDTIGKNTDVTLTLRTDSGASTSIPMTETESEAGEVAITAIRLTISPRDPGRAIADSEWGFVISHLETHVVSGEGGESGEGGVSGEGGHKSLTVRWDHLVADEPFPTLNPRDSLREKDKNGFAAYTRIHHPRTLILVPKSPIVLSDPQRLRMTLRHRHYLLASFPLVSQRGSVAWTDDPTIPQRLADPKLVRQRQQRSEIAAAMKRFATVDVPVMRERPSHLQRPTHVFHRGSFLDKGVVVDPGTPDALPPLNGDQSASRLDLAKWMTRQDHPLLDRVAVNRVWARMFGRGLVATEEDFGSTGEPPSHPQLLDDLAARHRDDMGRHLKSLVRTIALSATYRQSAKVRNDLPMEDRDNRYLARGPRFRMTAEMVRDAALSTSGLLVDRIGGPPVYPPIPGGVWKPFDSSKWPTAAAEDPNRYRRSIYTYAKRSIPFPMFAAFDSPSREFCNPRRLRSNTPLQALMTLNDIAFHEAAQELGRKMRQHRDNDRDELDWLFRSVVSRPPKPTELLTLANLQRDLQQSGMTPEQAATVAAKTVLNMDEAMTK